jgi:hypothetical protein
MLPDPREPSTEERQKRNRAMAIDAVTRWNRSDWHNSRDWSQVIEDRLVARIDKALDDRYQEGLDAALAERDQTIADLTRLVEAKDAALRAIFAQTQDWRAAAQDGEVYVTDSFLNIGDDARAALALTPSALREQAARIAEIVRAGANRRRELDAWLQHAAECESGCDAIGPATDDCEIGPAIALARDATLYELDRAIASLDDSADHGDALRERGERACVVAKGFLRDYRGSAEPGSHRPYRGVLHDENTDQPVEWRDAIIRAFRDHEGADVEIVVRFRGSRNAKADDEWVLLSPHEYGPRSALDASREGA